MDSTNTVQTSTVSMFVDFIDVPLHRYGLNNRREKVRTGM